MKPILATALALPAPVLAAGFERPIPEPQTQSAEFWFLVASVALIAALVAVHVLVSRR